MKGYGDVRVKFHVFQTSGLHEGMWLASHSAVLLPQKQPLLDRRLVGFQSHGGKEKSHPYWTSNTSCSVSLTQHFTEVSWLVTKPTNSMAQIPF
jgi:hypothetical protein